MHELWLCKNILEIVATKAAAIKCRKVKTIYLEMGNWTSCEKSVLLFNFAVIAKGTVAENARLEIIDTLGEELRVKSMEVE